MDQNEEEKNLPRQSTSVPETPHDADDAMLAFAGIDGENVVIDAATNKRLRKTIDWHLMPLMCVIYAMNSLDSMCLKQRVVMQKTVLRVISQLTGLATEATLTVANTMEMGEDIHLVGDNYQWLGSIFFFGAHHFQILTVS